MQFKKESLAVVCSISKSDHWKHNMDVENPKLAAFQIAVERVLLKRIAEEEERIKNLKKERDAKQQERARQTQKLCEAQRHLKQDERQLDHMSQEIATFRDRRRQLTKQNAAQNKQIQEVTIALGSTSQEKENLRMRLNRALEDQIVMESRRIHMAGLLNAGNVAATKTETSFQGLQNDKRLQDLYLENLESELDGLEHRVIDFVEQTNLTKAKTIELDQTVREAETEGDKLRFEKKKLLAKWNASVLEISKRDQAIAHFKEACYNQQLDLKRAKTEVQETRNDIISLQETHDHLTCVEQRSEKNCQVLKSQIRATDGLITDASGDLSKALKVKGATLKTLDLTSDEIRGNNSDLVKHQSEVTKLHKSLQIVQDQILLLCQDKATSEMSAKYTQKIVKGLRDSIAALETKLIEARNELSLTLQAMSARAEKIERIGNDSCKIEIKNQQLAQDVSKLEAVAIQMQAMIEKKQSLVDVQQKKKEVLVHATQETTLNPMERDLKIISDEIRRTEQFCNDQKAKWLKLQQDYILKSQIQNDLTATATIDSRKLIIMQAKTKKLEMDVQNLEEVFERLQKKIEGRDSFLKTLNSQYCDEKNRYEEALRVLEAKQGHDNHLLELSMAEVEAVRNSLTDLTTLLEAEKQTVLKVDGDLHDWEERVRACKETQLIVSSKKGREGELESLRTEVHGLQIRSETLQKQLKALVETLETSVQRREVLVDKVSNHEKIRRARHPQLHRTVETKRTLDLKLSLKNLCKLEKSLLHSLEAICTKNYQLSQELERCRAFLTKIEESIDEAEAIAAKQLTERDASLKIILQLQTRAKWYKAIKEKRYRLAIRDEDKGQQEIQSITEQNAQLLSAINGLGEDFPEFEDSLRKVASLL